MLYTCTYEAPEPLGPLALVANDHALVGLWMYPQRFAFENIDTEVPCAQETPVLREAFAWLDSYFRGEAPSIKSLALEPRGSAFRQEVWSLLQEIPYGETWSYGELAQEIAGRRGIPKMAAQAVGGAVGHNPIGIIIPCHRVVGSNGWEGGYGAGLERKRFLLELEAGL